MVLLDWNLLITTNNQAEDSILGVKYYLIWVNIDQQQLECKVQLSPSPW